MIDKDSIDKAKRRPTNGTGVLFNWLQALALLCRGRDLAALQRRIRSPRADGHFFR